MEDRLKKMSAQLERWVNVNSHTENRQGIDHLLHLLHEAFQILNPDVAEIVSLPQQRKALFLKKREKAPFKIFFGGHIDTVFPAHHPFQKGSFIDANIYTGPGAADMKGGLVVMLFALDDFEKLERASQIGWEIFINSDEEIGSPASTPFIEACALRCNLALLFEPLLEDGALVSQRKGSSNYYITSHGERAHAGRDFLKGKNAIYPLIKFLTDIETLNRPSEGVIINVGVIKGGEANNIVPDLAECHLNLRGDTLAQMEEADERLKQKAAIYKLELTRTSFRPPKPFEAATERYFNLLKACGSELGKQIRWKPSGGVCDGNTFAAFGVPVIDTLGVLGGKIHTGQEFVTIKSLTEQCELVTLFLKRIAENE